MTDVLAVVAIAVVALRVGRREFTRAELGVAAVALLGLGLIFAQCLVADNSLPEGRYYRQVGVLFVPWGVWLALRVRWGRQILCGILLALTVYHGVMFAKPHIRGTRREAYVSACNWAAELIQKDWKGGRRDPVLTYSNCQYHLPYRPCVHGITPRLGYLVGGRDEFMHVFGDVDKPDYWLTGRFDVAFSPEEYSLMGEFASGSRQFSLYRRKRD